MSILTDDELAAGAKGQAREWRVSVQGSGQRDTRTPWQVGPGVARPPSDYARKAVPMMMPYPPDDDTESRQKPPEYKLRCILALSVLNHRRTDDGLSAADVEVIRQVLSGPVCE